MPENNEIKEEQVPVETIQNVPENMRMEAVPETTPEQPVPKKKGKGGLIVVIILILLVVAVAGGIGAKVLLDGKTTSKNESNSSKTKETIKEKEEEKEEKEEEDTHSKEIEEKIIHFVKAGSHFDYGSDAIATQLHNGLTELSKEQKLLLTYFGVEDKFVGVEEVPEKYKDDEYMKQNVKKIRDEIYMMLQVKISDFEGEYKYLFNEDIGEYNVKEINGCPHPYLKDDELGVIFLSRNCGGTGNITFSSEIVKQTKDENYYYVYQKSGFNGELKEVVWKFDLNGNFISTTNNG